MSSLRLLFNAASFLSVVSRGSQSAWCAPQPPPAPLPGSPSASRPGTPSVRPYLSCRRAKAESRRVNQQPNAFFWWQIRTGPSIRHGLNLKDDARNMKTIGGGGAKIVFRPSADCGAKVRNFPSWGGEEFSLGESGVRVVGRIALRPGLVRSHALNCVQPVTVTSPPASRSPSLPLRLPHTHLWSQDRVAQQIMAAARLVVRPGMSQPHSSVRLLERGGREDRGCYPYRLCINKFYNPRRRNTSSFLLIWFIVTRI